MVGKVFPNPAIMSKKCYTVLCAIARYVKPVHLTRPRTSSPAWCRWAKCRNWSRRQDTPLAGRGRAVFILNCGGKKSEGTATNVRVVLFDIDGTLLHTGGVGIKAFARASPRNLGSMTGRNALKFSGRTGCFAGARVFTMHQIEPTPATFLKNSRGVRDPAD